MNNAAIIGLGALGTLYGQKLNGFLGREGFFFIADEQRVARYRQRPVFCNGQRCDFSYRSPSEAQPVDLILFAVKAGGLADAIETVRPFVGPQTVLISVLNGITSEEMLAEAFGAEKVIWCVAEAMDAVYSDGQLQYTNIGRLALGNRDGRTSPQLEALAALLKAAGIPYEISDQILLRQWGKLMLNTGVNQVTAVFDLNYGGVQKPGRPREMMIGAMREVAQVAQKEGIPLSEEDIPAWVALPDRLDAENTTSMCQDVRAGRRTEKELFSGTICRLGRKHGVATPINDELYRRLTELENRA